MPLNYEERYQEAYRLNVEKAPQQAEQRKLDSKINNFCSLHGFSRDHVRQQIKSNPVVAACFAINPNKQNFYENTAVEYIRSIPGVEKFEKLRNSDDALAVIQGEVLDKNRLNAREGASLAGTIDFRWEYGSATFYASHTYTKEDGGSQGDRHKNLQIFIEQAKNAPSGNTFFIAIADGPFYSGRDRKAGVSRMERLQELASGAKVSACRIDDLEARMKKLRAG